MLHLAKSKTNGCSQISEGVRSTPIKLLNYQDQKVSLIDTLHTKAVKDGSHCTSTLCRGSIMLPSYGNRQQNKEQVLAEAEDFLSQYYNADDKCDKALAQSGRWQEIRRSVEVTGTYEHTASELIFGAKTAWRNAPRCIGRIQWSKLQVFDARKVTTTKDVFAAICEHLQYATNGGNIRSAITVFAPNGSNSAVRIWNSQFIRYAGYEREDGSVIGDPASVELTKICLKLGWKATSKRTRFDVLPIVLSDGDNDPDLYELPRELIKEVPLIHPRFPKFNGLKLRWYAVPAVSSMGLNCGGLYYHACGFNGWYQSTEIVRDFCDVQRYNLLKEIAISFGLDTWQPAVFWKDIAMAEMNSAVMHSYQAQGVTIVDQYSASESFMTHLSNEHKLRGGCPSDWVWVVPPIGAEATAIWHQELLNYKLLPFYEYQAEPWVDHKWKKIEEKTRRQRKLTLRCIFRAATACTILMMEALAARKQCTILYATETGKSEKFARILASIFECVFNVKLCRMDQYDHRALQHESLLLVVTSTFGTGRPPDNGEDFYGFLLTEKDEVLRNSQMAEKTDKALDSAAPAQTLYAVFGLGSTAYPNHCAFAQEVDILLEKIGFQRLLSLTKGDEISGQEETFHVWCKTVFEAALKTFDLKSTTYVTRHLLEFNEEAEWKSEDYRIVKPTGLTMTSHVQGLKRIHNTKVLEFAVITVQDLKQSSDRMIQVNLKTTQDVQFYPGDHLAVFPENADRQVDAVLQRVTFGQANGELTGETIVRLQSIRGTACGKTDWISLGRVPDCSLRTALKYFFDISAPPTRHFLGALAVYAENVTERQTLFALSKNEKDYQRWLADSCPSTVDLLSMFPSLVFPATLLLTLLPILKPRYYSISSSPAKYSQEVHLTVGVVQYNIGSRSTDSSSAKTKFGLCSNWLSVLQPGDVVRGFTRIKESFHMPSAVQSPVIMVCQGSGIAPFRGFWQQLDLNRQSIRLTGGSNFCEAHLYFGCRNKKDVVYQQELDECYENGTLTSFNLALSRQADKPKTYVQDLIKQHASRIHDVIYVRNGHIYICGNVNMAQDVTETIVYILQDIEKLSIDAAREYLHKMKGDSRFHEDIFGAVWSSAEASVEKENLNIAQQLAE